MTDHYIFTSCGNDSLALIQWAHENKVSNVTAIYNNTGWSAPWWPERVSIAKEWVESLGFKFVETKGIGMEELVYNKKAWPRGGGGKFQFCTKFLKELPTIQWLDENDPDCEGVCMVGIRREEGESSKSARLTMPEWTEESERHGGRALWAPLVRHRTEDRNALLAKTPFEPLPYRSKECYPCVNAGKGELKLLPEERIIDIERIENTAGVNSKGNQRVMFSPQRHNGAVGIRAVVEDARKNNTDLFEISTCASGWCED